MSDELFSHPDPGGPHDQQEPSEPHEPVFDDDEYQRAREDLVEITERMRSLTRLMGDDDDDGSAGVPARVPKP